MSRVIRLDSSGKERKRLSKEVVLAVRQLIDQTAVSDQTRDLAAFITLNLEEMSRTIDASVEAWEKRGYWVKADQYRLKWEWCDTLSKKLKEAIIKEDWDSVAVTTAQVAEKLKDIILPKNNRLGTPWVGAWERLREQSTHD